MTTIVTFGDSTTAPRGPLTVYADLLRQELPQYGIAANVINSGVGGNSTADGRTRWQTAVLDHKPNITIIQFGINDSTIELYKTPPATTPRLSLTQYIANIEYFINSLRQHHCQPILMTPNPMRWVPRTLELYGQPPYQPTEVDGFNVILRDYAATIRDIAKCHHTPLIDIYTTFQNYNHDGTTTADLLLDGMHPNALGHRLTATLIIATLLTLNPANVG